MATYYQLPQLPYQYNALEPFMSEKLLRLHHDKHHAVYVDSANEILKKLEEGRKNNQELNMADLLKTLSFHVGGHVLHSLFWKNMKTPGDNNVPSPWLGEKLVKEFGSMERFKWEFAQSAKQVQGSGWSALSFCRKTQRPMIMHIQNHNLNIYPSFKILLVLDVWEHAFYLDYENKKADFVDGFWSVVNWEKVEERLKQVES